MRAARASSSRSAYFLWHSASSAHFSIQLAVALNPATGARARKRLRSSLRWALDEALARREDLEEFEYVALARHGAVLLRLATNPRTPLAAIDWMINYGDQFVSQLARIHPSRPIERIHKVADDGNAPKWLLRRLAASPSLSEEVQERVLVWLALGGGTGDPNFDPVTCVGTPGEPGQPRDQAFRDAGGLHPGDSSLWVTRMMKSVGASTLTFEVIGQMARDSHPAVRSAAARYRAASNLRELRRDPDPAVRRQAESTWNDTPKSSRRRQSMTRQRTVSGKWARMMIPIAGLLIMTSIFSRFGDEASTPTSTSDPREFIDRLDQPTWVVASGPSPLLENRVVCRSATSTVHVVRDGIVLTVDVSSGAENVPVDFRLYAEERLLDQFEAGVRAGAHGTYQVASFDGTRVEVRVGENADRRMVVPLDASLDVMVTDREGDC